MLLTPQRGLVLCALVSAALLGGALLFEHVGGMAPCSLCIWQRWAHVAVIVCALGWLVISQPIGASLRAGLAVTALAGMASVGIAGYHAGVEWQLWAGPA